MPTIQASLPGMDSPRVFNRMMRNAAWCRRFAHSYRRDGNLAQFRIWMKLAHKSVGTARRLVQAGVIAAVAEAAQ